MQIFDKLDPPETDSIASCYCPLLTTACLKTGCAMFVIDWRGVPEDSSSPVLVAGHCGLITHGDTASGGSHAAQGRA